jgi:bifunctional non-homologous end joining protein LigD
MSDLLDEYNRKRDFNATPEPAGSGAGKTKKGAKNATEHALTFCIQKHDATRLHYDFRLEIEGTLKSWAVPKGPSLDPGVKRLAMHVEDHPLEYATFEGNIPEGHYGAGDVIVWDRGVWRPVGDPVESYRKGRIKFELQGEKLSGEWNLVRTRQEGKQEPWFLIKHQDAAARSESDYDIVKALPDSVLSDRTLTPRKRKGKAVDRQPAAQPRAPGKPARGGKLNGARATPLPETLKPELATLVESPPAGEWRYELKFDGYRMLARIDNGDVKLFTRNGHDWTAKLPRQAEALASLGLESAWLDGEMIVTDPDGAPSFQLLQNAFETHKSGAIIFYLFDMPYLNGMDLRGVPIEQRRGALATVLERSEDEILRFSEDFGEDAGDLLTSACQIKMEGLIGKRQGSLYVSRRSDDWIKLKCHQRQEFVIVGYSDPKGARTSFGALLLGLHDAESGQLRYAGKVGTGFNSETLRTLHARLKPLETARPAVSNAPTGYEAKGVHWLKPQLLAEVAYAEITQEGAVRHAVFRGLRNDKPAADITRETPKPVEQVETGAPASRPRAAGTAAKTPKAAKSGDGKIRITHADRVIDPASGTTKMQLAEYYVRVAEWILPTLENRPVALVRAPEGVPGELFFQKNVERLAIPGIETLENGSVMLINNAEALVGAVQMSTIEFHAWNALAPDLDRPDRFVLDLDPDPALPWKSMVEATQLTLTVLDELGLQSFIKTSGGKGIHVVVPLTPRDDWDTVKAFSQSIVKYMARLIPDRFSAVSGPKNRIGRIFIDYLRNGRGATTINAYAARSRPGLAVSVPLFKEEIHDIKGADAWNIQTVHQRLAELDDDPWADLPAVQQTITADMRRRLQT